MDINEINALPLTDEEQVGMLIEAGEDGAADLIEELLDLFQSESGPQLESLKVAVASGDMIGASRPAHAVAGSSANLGGLRLSKLAKAMEIAADGGDGATLKSLGVHIEALYAETVGAFQAEIAKLRA